MSDQNKLTVEQNRQLLIPENNEQATEELNKDKANEANLGQNETNEDNNETLHSERTSEPCDADDRKSPASNEGQMNKEKESEGIERAEGTYYEVKMEEARRSR